MLEESLFQAHPSGRDVLPEYLSAVKKIIIHPDIMAGSRLRDTLCQLSKLEKVPDIATAIDEAMNACFEGEYSNYVSVAEMDYHGNLKSDLQAVYNSFIWEQLYLCNAIHILTKAKDVRLKSLLGLLGRGQQECAARRRMAFTVIVTAAGSHLSNTNASSITADFDQHVEKIRFACIEYIEDLKEKAFRSVFLEPSLLYFEINRENVNAGDVDVHGSNTYLTVLEATSGIKIPRIPLIDDDIKGVVDISNANIDDHIKEIRRPENVGKSYRSFLKKIPQSTRRVPSNVFLFNLKDSQVIDIATKAIDDNPSTFHIRQNYVKYYLEPFSKYFSADIILPQLCNMCFQDESLRVSLQKVFEDIKEKYVNGNMDGIESNLFEECDDVRYFVWEMENIPPAFKLNAAQLLFDTCNVTYTKEKLNLQNLLITPPIEQTTSIALLSNATVTKLPTFTPSETSHELKNRIPKELITLSAAGDIRGGGTGREYLANLLNDGHESWNKWVHPGRGIKNSWVLAKFSVPVHFTGYALCSANDCQERDPMAWEVLGMSSDGQWTKLHEVDYSSNVAEGFTRRWHYLAYVLPEPVRLVSVKINFTKFRGESDCIQLGHLHCYFNKTLDIKPKLPEIDLVKSFPKFVKKYTPNKIDSELGSRIASAIITLSAADDVRGGGTGREYLANLLNDGHESWNKWVHPGRGIKNSWILAKFSVPVHFTGYALCSANDCQERDPMAWEVLGMSSDGQWTKLHKVDYSSNAAEGFTRRWHYLAYVLPEPVRLVSVKINFTKFRGESDCIQLGHLHLFEKSESDKETPKPPQSSFWDRLLRRK